MNVQEAEAQLKQAKVEEAAKAQDALRAQLADIRAQLRVARANYASLSKRIRDGEAQVARVQAQINDVVEELTLSMLNRPEITNVLPEDEEAALWAKEHAKLIERRDRAIQRRDAIIAMLPNRLEAAKYEGNNGVVAKLEAAQHNLVRRINGEPLGASWEGGVYRVL
jgi:uncharacterized protein YhaN